MRKGANLFGIIGAVVALWLLLPITALAADGGESDPPSKQAGEDRWVPSLAITSGITIQNQDGSADSVLFEGINPIPIPRRGFFKGDDNAVSPFVGGTLELMAPAFPIPTRPRLFVSGEILPTFASDRDLALEGDPGCIRGPEPDAPCARDEDGSRVVTFGEDAVNGDGSKTSAQIDTLVFGASLGVAFPLKIGERQLRIKPSVGWINYKVEAEGVVVDAACGTFPAPPPQNTVNRCTDVGANPGFLRETVLRADDSQRFNGIGPGLDIEMDAARYGPLGVSVFMGGRAYAIVDDRKITFDDTETFGDQLGVDTAVGRFEVEVDSWIFRAHMGIRFHWLGNAE